MNALIVVADAAHARLFRTRTSLHDITELEDRLHTESRRRDRELAEDTGGRTGDQQSTLDPRTSPKEQEERNFARELGRHLEELRQAEGFEQLILVSPPRFLGMLREALPAPLQRVEQRSVHKEMLHASAGELADYLKQHA